MPPLTTATVGPVGATRPIRVDEWSFFDVHCDVNHAGRSLIRGSLYDGSGRLCLSMAQEMLIRPVG